MIHWLLVSAPLIAVELSTTERQSGKKFRKGATKFYAEPQNFKESRNIGILLECSNNAKVNKITILCTFSLTMAENMENSRDNQRTMFYG